VALSGPELPPLQGEPRVLACTAAWLSSGGASTKVAIWNTFPERPKFGAFPFAKLSTNEKVSSYWPVLLGKILFERSLLKRGKG